MRIIFLFLLILIAGTTKSQTQFKRRGMGYFHVGKQKHEGDCVFKIYHKKYKTDHDKFFASGNDTVYRNLTNDLIHFMVYDERYLFVGYYDDTEEQRRMAPGFSVRSINQLDIIDLEDPTVKWNYKVNKQTSLDNIIKFDPQKGYIEYANVRRIWADKPQ